VFVFSIVPLSEHSIVERMSAKINLELVGLNVVSQGKKKFYVTQRLTALIGLFTPNNGPLSVRYAA